MERKEQLGDEAQISKERGLEHSEKKKKSCVRFPLILSETPGFLEKFTVLKKSLH